MRSGGRAERASLFVNQSTTLQSVRRGCMSLASDEQTPRANQLMTDWFDRTPPADGEKARSAIGPWNVGVGSYCRQRYRLHRLVPDSSARRCPRFVAMAAR